MEFLKKSIHMDQIGCEEQTQITLEDDINIADAKPDVYQVVTQQGHVELEEVRASDGHVHVKGVLHFKVLYLADEETHHPACMEGELAFEEQILMGSVSGTDQVQAQAILEDLSVGMINSRKLSVQALLQIRLFTERMKQLDVAVGLEGTEQIEVKQRSYKETHRKRKNCRNPICNHDCRNRCSHRKAAVYRQIREIQYFISDIYAQRHDPVDHTLFECTDDQFHVRTSCFFFLSVTVQYPHSYAQKSIPNRLCR